MRYSLNYPTNIKTDYHVKTAIRIAKIELNSLFYSPIAWLMLIVFFIQTSIAFSGVLSYWITVQELGGQYTESREFFTSKIFGTPAGIIGTIAYNLFLYLPLLTMGLISREISSGTIKLLYSSPIRIRNIVLGKFMAIAAYSLVLTMAVALFELMGVFFIEGVDMGLLLSCLLSIFLLLCAYGAIGLFVSSLTSYQVVAAIGTFVLFAFLNYLSQLWQDIDFFRDITYALSLSGRTNKMAAGLITSKDLIYFIIIVILFLGLTMLRLRGKRSAEGQLVKTGKHFALILSVVVIGYFTSQPQFTLYFDATSTKTQTLTKASQKILKDMGDEPVEVNSYINLLDNTYWNGQPVLRNTDFERWEPYLRFKPNVKLNYTYYYDSIPNPDFYKANAYKSLDELAKNHAKSFRLDLDRFKKPEEIRKIIDLKPELGRYVMHVKYRDKSTYLRLFDDALVFPTERETGAALKRLITTLPKIGFLEGHLERSPTRGGDKDYRVMTSQITFRYSMVNQGFDVTTVSLKNGDIPADISALVIADPKAELDSVVLRKVSQYIDKGGNLFILGEPGKQQVLNPLLQTLGVEMMDGMIVQKSDEFSPSLVLPYFTPASAALSKVVAKDFKDSAFTDMPGVAPLKILYSGPFKAQSFLETDERKSWRKTGALSADSLQVSFNGAEGDEKGKFVTMLGLTRMVNGHEQRIIVSGDADFMSSLDLARGYPETANFRFTTTLFGWLSNGQFPVDVSRPDARDIYIHLKGTDMPLIKAFFMWIIPFVFFILGTILLMRRKKQ
jgi:ABC-2 type transport system permease protein